MKKLCLILLNIIIVSILSACFESNDVEWDFEMDMYESPDYYTIIYGTEYGGIESLRISEKSIVGVNHYFNGFYLIESNPNVYYYKYDNMLYEITYESDGYVCNSIDEYDSNIYIEIDKFENDLFSSTYMTKGDFPYRYTVSVGESDPFIEFHNVSFPYIEFDYHHEMDLYYYTVIYRKDSIYSAPELDPSCFSE